MITEEQVQKDLSRVFRSKGEGSERDRAAGQLLSLLDILESRLNFNPELLKIIYLSDREEVSMLPSSIYQLVERIVNGDLSYTDAVTQLAETRKAYEMAFEVMGITPTLSTTYFFTK